MVENEQQSERPIAVVTGASSGIGAVIAEKLIDTGYAVYGASREPGATGISCDLSRPSGAIELAHRCQAFKPEVIVLNAGDGAIEYFHSQTPKSLQKQAQLNALSPAMVLNVLMPYLLENTVRVMVTTSVAGHLPSPLMASYAATKSYLVSLIGSLNAELAKLGSGSRLFEFCPGKILGTRFHGGEMSSEHIADIEHAVAAMLRGESRYICQWDAVYRSVFERARRDAAQFALESFDYKVAQLQDKPIKRKVGYLSGTFDVFHYGHIEILRRARQCCDVLVVGVHRQVKHKKKPTYHSYETRFQNVSCTEYPDLVIPAEVEDVDVLRYLPYDILMVGSDYKGTERFQRYEKIMAENGGSVLYFPYTKTVSSSAIRELIEDDGS